MSRAQISMALEEAGYSYVVHGHRILVPSKSNSSIPKGTGIIIEPGNDTSRIILLTESRVSESEARRLLELNMHTTEYFYAMDPEGFMAIVSVEPTFRLLSPERLRQVIGRLVEAYSRGGMLEDTGNSS